MTALRVDNELSEWKSVKRGVWQGCVLSPDLFSLYSEMILRDIEGIGGITVRGRNINNVRFADDKIFVAETEKELLEILDAGVTSSEAKGLMLNCKKTVSVVFTRESDVPNCVLRVHSEVIEKEEHFVYLGGELTSDGKSDKEVKKRIEMAKATFNKLKTVLINHQISMTTKLRILKCYACSVLLYGCKDWTLHKNLEYRIHSCEMWFLRRLLRVSWNDRETNESVLQRAGVRRQLLAEVKKRQMKFFGLVIRKDGIENLIVTGKIEEKRTQRRQRYKLSDTILRWSRSEINSIIHKTRNREDWRAMTVNVCNRYDI